MVLYGIEIPRMHQLITPLFRDKFNIYYNNKIWLINIIINFKMLKS